MSKYAVVIGRPSHQSPNSEIIRINCSSWLSAMYYTWRVTRIIRQVYGDVRVARDEKTDVVGFYMVRDDELVLVLLATVRRSPS